MRSLLTRDTGLLMDVYGYEMPQCVHNALTKVTCDVPASRKIRGHASFVHKTQMCDQCEMTLNEIQTTSGYDIDSKSFLSLTSNFANSFLS